MIYKGSNIYTVVVSGKVYWTITLPELVDKNYDEAPLFNSEKEARDFIDRCKPFSRS